MNEWIVFLLPPAMALAGTRINRLLFGPRLGERFGFGVRFALGLAGGMLILSQAVLLSAIIGIDAVGFLARVVLIWGAIEALLLVPEIAAGPKRMKLRRGHLWFLLLIPVLYSWSIFGRLSTLEGTLEFDAVAFWVFKAKILYLTHGRDLLAVLRQSDLAYAHMDYPLLVPCLYVLDYGVSGGVNEFVNKVWPFWMLVSLCAAIISLAQTWQRPRPFPLLLVLLICFLPATFRFLRLEGATMPMVFFTGMSAMLLVIALSHDDTTALAAGILTLAGSAATKFEGIIYAAMWAVVIGVFVWRRSWLKDRLLWKTIALSVICLVPYCIFRLCGPAPHPEAAWVSSIFTSGRTVLHRFAQTLLLAIGGRFFDADFFQWKAADGSNIHWAGGWNGWHSFVNEDMSILPWLLVLLLVLGLSFAVRHRAAVAILLGATLGELVILSFVIASLPRMQNDTAQLIDFCGYAGARYFYPFFTACFLGATVPWLVDERRIDG